MSPALYVSVVSETWPPEVNGVAHTLARLTQTLSKRGHDVQIVRPRQRHERKEEESESLALALGLPIPGYPSLRFGLPIQTKLMRLWRTRRPDVVHVATEGPLGLSALFAAKRLGIPLISTYHTNFHSYSTHYGWGWCASAIIRYLRWFHNQTLVTLAPAYDLAARLVQRGFRRVDVLGRGVDTQLFSPQRRSMALRAQWGVQAGELVCLYVGRIASEKNLDLLFAAHQRLLQADIASRLVCIGDGPLLDALRRRHPECIFPGAFVGEKLAACYASADIFLFPSMTETYGNVVLEALASGLPVVAYGYAAALDLIQPGLNGLVAPFADASAFLDATIEAARRLKAGALRREDCVASVCERNWAKVCERYENFLREAARQKPYESLGSLDIHCVPD